MVSIDNVIESNLTSKQVGAITRSIKLGRTLQEDYPHIAEFWKQSNYLPKVVEMLDIQNEYGVTSSVAIVCCQFI